MHKVESIPLKAAAGQIGGPSSGTIASYPVDPGDPDPSYLTFWQERHLCTLTTPRPDGSPHVVSVGVTYAPEARPARVVADKSSRKVANMPAAGPLGARVAVCQADGRRRATPEGRAFVRAEPDRVAEAEHRYAGRYGRTPSPNPSRW